MDNVAKFLLELLALGGGAAAMAYAVFKGAGEKWLENKFSERLERLRQAHDREVQAVGFRIDAILDRTQKLHEKEFEVLPRAWDLLNEAFWTAAIVLKPMKRYVDLAVLNSEARIEVLNGSGLLPSQIKLVYESLDPNHEFQRFLEENSIGQALGLAREAHVFLVKHGIFIEPDLRLALRECHDVLWKALIELQNNFDPEHRPADHRFQQYGEHELKLLETRVYERLQPGSPI